MLIKLTIAFKPWTCTHRARHSLGLGMPVLVHDMQVAGMLALVRILERAAHSRLACCRFASGSNCRTECGVPRMERDT